MMRPSRRDRWFADSPLEQAGFEPSVPLNGSDGSRSNFPARFLPERDTKSKSLSFRRRIWLTDTASGSMKPINLRIGKGSGRPRAADRCSHLVLAGGGTVPFGQFTATLRVEPDRYSSQCQRAGDTAAAPGRDAAAGQRVPAGADRGARRPRDVSTPIRSGAARENVRPAAASVTVDTIVARREERACRQEPT